MNLVLSFVSLYLFWAIGITLGGVTILCFTKLILPIFSLSYSKIFSYFNTSCLICILSMGCNFSLICNFSSNFSKSFSFSRVSLFNVFCFTNPRLFLLLHPPRLLHHHCLIILILLVLLIPHPI